MGLLGTFKIQTIADVYNSNGDCSPLNYSIDRPGGFYALLSKNNQTWVRDVPSSREATPSIGQLLRIL
jgi:hypothetical protein